MGQVILLHIDDDSDELLFFSMAVKLIDSSIKCLSAKGADEAFDMLLRAQPEMPCIIFLDLNMPLVSGKEFLKLFRAKPGYNEVPVVIYTTSNNEQDKVETHDLGANYFLIKKAGSIKSIATEIGPLINQYCNITAAG